MNKAIFLDRDGTINEDPIGHIYQIKDLKFIPFAIEGLKKLQESKYNLIIITNQGGIGKNLYTKKNYFTLRKEIHKQLSYQGIKILAEYFCPHNPDEHCNCRKPETGMLEEAAENFNLCLNECWMIGDKYSDILAGKNANCKTIHILTGQEKKPIDYADFVAENLFEAANYILSNNNK
jgi:D-glycero-D-manno-heptose 1,7-bisphosphate phosphatase